MPSANIAYFSCALTGAGKGYYEACSFYEQLRDRIEMLSPCRLLLPHLHDPSTGLALPPGSADYQAAAVESSTVYSLDVRLIEQSNVVIAWLEHPSHGVGAELAIAAALGKPIIAVCFPGLSKFLDGLLDTHKAIKLRPKVTITHTAWAIAQALERLNATDT